MLGPEIPDTRITWQDTCPECGREHTVTRRGSTTRDIEPGVALCPGCFPVVQARLFGLPPPPAPVPGDSLTSAV